MAVRAQSRPRKISPVKSADDFLPKIEAAYRRSSEEMFKLAQVCAEANATLSADEKRKLLQRLPFDEASFSKFAKVGADERLKRPEVQKRLPASYSIVYEIAKFDDETLELARKDGVLRKDLKRSELQTWVQAKTKRRPASASSSSRCPNDCLLALRPRKRMKAQELERLGAIIGRALKELPVDLLLPKDAVAPLLQLQQN